MALCVAGGAVWQVAESEKVARRVAAEKTQLESRIAALEARLRESKEESERLRKDIEDSRTPYLDDTLDRRYRERERPRDTLDRRYRERERPRDTGSK